jgi:hypothetical protein
LKRIITNIAEFDLYINKTYNILNNIDTIYTELCKIKNNDEKFPEYQKYKNNIEKLYYIIISIITITIKDMMFRNKKDIYMKNTTTYNIIKKIIIIIHNRDYYADNDLLNCFEISELKNLHNDYINYLYQYVIIKNKMLKKYI